MVRRFGFLLAAALALVALARPAAAQDEKPVQVNLGGGVIFPSGDFKNDFNAGGLFQAGATFWFKPNIGIEADYNYAKMTGPEKTILVSPTPSGAGSAQLIESNQQMHVGLFDVVYRAHKADSPVGGYVLGGLGIYHRILQLTSPAVGYATVCDPYWYVCYPAAVSVDNILGDRSSNDFGINFGGGVNFGHVSGAQFFAEARFHYVWGPKITPPAGATGSATYNTNFTYYPLTFGVRF